MEPADLKHTKPGHCAAAEVYNNRTRHLVGSEDIYGIIRPGVIALSSKTIKYAWPTDLPETM